MPLYTPTRSAQRFLGDSKTKIVHDLLNEQPECKALEIIAARRGERFVPDNLEFALSDKVGYKACPYCLPMYAVQDSGEKEEAAEPAGKKEAAEEA